MNKTVWLGVIIWIALMAAGYYYYTQRQAEQAAVAPITAEPPTTTTPSTASATRDRFDESGEPRYPVPAPKPARTAEPQVAEPQPRPARAPEPEPEPEPLPELNNSDRPVEQDLAQVTGRDPIESFLVPNRIIERLVVWLTSLDGEAVPLRFRPLRHTPGLFAVDKEGDRLTVSEQNPRRYDAQINVLSRVDAASLVAVYLRYYPLFQEAYADLGQSGRHFNDRMIHVIDHLLAAPEISSPIKLVRPKVQYRFADPGLEALSSGQKAMIRIGPAHAKTVKRKLRQIRAEILRQTQQADLD